MQILGLKDAWNYTAWFDYMDRFWGIMRAGVGAFTAQMWTTYRSLGGPIWNQVVTPVPPTITNQPQSLTVTAGLPASFTISSSGTTPLTYQWRKNGSNISGATGTEYAIPSTVSGDAGTYDCVVTNSVASVTSSAAVLTVNAAVPPSVPVPQRSARFPRKAVLKALT
jgi:hypothetical protein